MHPNLSLKDLVIQPIPPHLFDATVANMSFEDGTWDFAKFSYLLPPEVIYEIQGRMGAHAALGADVPIWDLNQNDTFSVRTAYKLINKDRGQENRCWRVIWDQDIPQRTKVFLWLLFKGGLRTKAYLFDRGICTSSSCDRCQQNTETTLHALRDCSLSRDVWSFMQANNFNPHFASMDLNHWLMSNLEQNTVWKNGLSWGSTFALVIWEANSSADALAKLALEYPIGLFLHSQPPRDVVPFITADVMGASSYRRVPI
ncbi:Reverse transcriptase zinc-binding domain [Sesbania bispinosa]|nr:Reverse transcriptase zinc-binding domain [Sesbania bispinosa]